MSMVIETGLLGHALLVVVTALFIWVGSGWLERGSEELAGHYGLPAVVQGSVVVAVGSSFPELVTVVVTALSGVPDMGVGGIVGSAVFNVLVIPAAAGLATASAIESSRTIVYKEAQFYMIAVSALIVTFALAVIYEPVTTSGELVGNITRPLALIPLALYGLYLFIQYQDVSDAAQPTEPTDSVSRMWGLLGGGLLIILVSVHQLVASVESLSTAFGVPEFMAGVTIIAAATSLPDTLVSVRSAKGGNGSTSLGNVLGSNTFDLLVAIPIGVLIAGKIAVNFAVAAPMMGVLTVATILLFTVLRTELTLTTTESLALLGAYFVFVGWVAAESMGLSHLIRGA
ncbi:sodium:calcium antiporter [Halocatena halophila]|uniref:sodium:calcium antiporter n=1 Tax=Halocatena halophila TaxID=2814576 RepID=UPI0038B38526